MVSVDSGVLVTKHESAVTLALYMVLSFECKTLNISQNVSHVVLGINH